MSDLPDYDLQKTPDAEAVEVAPGSRRRMVVVVALLLIAALAGYFVWERRESAAPPPATQQPVAPSHGGDVPLGGEPTAINLPPLDETDPLVRELVSTLSSHPAVAMWLATGGLIRGVAATVANVGEGVSPVPHLRALRPASTFQVVESGEALYIDPASYHRFDMIADAVASLDPQGSARLYTSLKPRIEEAYRDLGMSGVSLDQMVERAIVQLLAVPVVDGQVRVEPRGIVYGLVREDLERLSPAQKQLLRTGPRNMRLIQRALRDIAVAMKIPGERLPLPLPEQ